MILIEMEDGGKIVLQLYPEIAPITVANFEKLVSDGFYDGLIFHRVWKDFMIQGGDPKGNGTGGSDKTIKGEFSLNGVNNTLSHTRGVISMARSDSYDSASSQFFIVHADSPHLNGQYAAFGKVLEGMDVVDKIASVKVNNAKKPLAEQKIKSITIISDISNSEDVSAESNTSDVISTENSTEDSSN
ncbi:MAG TPA: peptidylprolyl isomerase [Clostridiales bacterium]|nr:peptidylprolyl isomerase [Clostridiales bacterium]